MKVSKYLMAVAAASLATAPAFAAPTNAASPLSLGKSVRAGSKVKHSDQLAGGGFIIAILAVAAVAAGIVVVADNKDHPESP